MLKAVVAEPALARGCLGYCPVGLMSLGRGPSGRPGRETKTARIGCAPSTYVLSGWGQVGNLHFSAPGRRGRGKPPRGRLGLLGRLDPASASTHRVVFKFLGFPFCLFCPPPKGPKLAENRKFFCGRLARRPETGSLQTVPSANSKPLSLLEPAGQGSLPNGAR